MNRSEHIEAAQAAVDKAETELAAAQPHLTPLPHALALLEVSRAHAAIAATLTE
ncbi:hypothetical protein [Nocardia takedensis]|uniref:hypothetical protein n=1 Tax=Nocardia takedensis TaxID=259390 RepID=UPI0002E85B36|nr:hypothetical protein [Nocardia takedensis]